MGTSAAGPDGSDRRDASFGTAAYGGSGFSPRVADHRDEIGTMWADHAVDSEWARLRAVLLHRPGPELDGVTDPDAAQMLAPLDTARAAAEHHEMAAAYESAGVAVHHVDPDGSPPPNQMFCADTSVMTPAGALLARPASTVRAGEERHVARRLADLGVPILATLTGGAVFEGADLMWLTPSLAAVARGPRTNQEAIDQITGILDGIGCTVASFDLPFGTMHLMGVLRIVDRDLAIAWPRRTPHALVRLLEDLGTEVVFAPLGDAGADVRAINFVTLAPRSILMPAGLPDHQRFYEDLGIECSTTPTDELSRAAGNVGCLTAVLSREPGSRA